MASVQELPNELLGSILTLLEVPNLANAQRVCRKWKLVCSSSAIPLERHQLADLYNHVVTAECPYRAIQHRVAPFLSGAFDRTAYLSRLRDCAPQALRIWLLEYPEDGLIGWHWPDLKDKHLESPHDDPGIDLVKEKNFARHMKPGYSLLSQCVVDELKFPLRPQDRPVLVMERKQREDLGWAEPEDAVIKAKALQVWINWMTGGEPEVTWLLLSGAGPYNGSVWGTQPDSRFVVHTIADIGRISKLSWDRKLADSWIEYLTQEWRSLRFRYDCLPQSK